MKYINHVSLVKQNKKRHINLSLVLLVFFVSMTLNVQAKQIERFKEIKRIYKTMSPKIVSLLKLKKNDLNIEVEKTWLSAKKNGLPLIEEDPLDSEYNYITFMFQDNLKNKDISFEVKGIYDEYRFGNKKLYQLENTDLFYRTYKMPGDICFSYRFIIKDTVSKKETKSIDKYNLNRIPTGEINKFTYSVFDPQKKKQDWNRKGDHKLNSRVEIIKYKDKIVNKERNIYVYLPPGYKKNRKMPYPVIYLFDAFIYRNRIEVPNVLDNLIRQKKIKPMIAVLFGTFRKSRKIILPLNFKFKDEFVQDFLPMIRKKYHTSLKPENNIIGGISYGGLAAAFISFYHPRIFGKVLSQSGSFWRGLELKDMSGEQIRVDWLIEKYLRADKKGLRLYLDWGLQENKVLGSNRRMVKVLNKKKYAFKFTEFNGWHDWSNSRKTFPEALMYLLK